MSWTGKIGCTSSRSANIEKDQRQAGQSESKVEYIGKVTYERLMERDGMKKSSCFQHHPSDVIAT